MLSIIFDWKTYIGRFLSASAVCATVSLLIALVIMPNDFGLFVIATVPYSLLVGALGVTTRGLQLSSLLSKIGIITLVAISSSYVWSIALLGTVAFGFYPLEALQIGYLYYWGIGCLLGLIVALSVGQQSEKADSRMPRVTTLALLALLPLLCAGATISILAVSLEIPKLLTPTEPETILLSSGYIGPVLIVYEQAAGQVPEFDGNARLHRIPNDGILLTQLAKPDTIRQQFWYVDENGNKTQSIRWGAGCVGDIPANSVVACLQTVASNEGKPEYVYLIIGPFSEQSRIANESYGRISAFLAALPRK